jgi:hypothetical protein
MILGCRIIRRLNWPLILVHNKEEHAKYDIEAFQRRNSYVFADLMCLLVVLLNGETAEIDEIVVLLGQFSLKSVQGSYGSASLPFHCSQLEYSPESVDFVMAPSHWMRADSTTSQFPGVITGPISTCYFVITY